MRRERERKEGERKKKRETREREKNRGEKIKKKIAVLVVELAFFFRGEISPFQFLKFESFEFQHKKKVRFGTHT